MCVGLNLRMRGSIHLWSVAQKSQSIKRLSSKTPKHRNSSTPEAGGWDFAESDSDIDETLWLARKKADSLSFVVEAQKNRLTRVAVHQLCW